LIQSRIDPIRLTQEDRDSHARLWNRGHLIQTHATITLRLYTP
jgi:hypothetical protein